MLAGLIFATDDAQDRPDMLAASLPFGGSTLIEFQARLLVGAGASQLIVVVTRLTPELNGALNRIGRRGVSLDIVRSAREASEKLHPLARVLVFADGLITNDRVLGMLSGEGRDAILVTNDADALVGLERVGHDAIWAGMARVGAQRIAEVAALPADYDFESTLLRVAAQGGAEQVPLPAMAVEDGHLVERDAARLRDRNAAMMASLVTNRIPWVDRYVIAPVARLVLPALVARAVPGIAISAGAGLVLVTGLGVIAWGWPGIGLVLVVLSMAALTTAEALSWARDEPDQARFQRAAVIGGAALAILLLGSSLSRATGDAGGIVAALSLVMMAGLVERGASNPTRRRWWASPPAFPLIALPFVATGQALAGLLIGAGYAAISLLAVIEALRARD